MQAAGPPGEPGVTVNVVEEERLDRALRERDEAREALRPFVREYERNGCEYVPDTLILDNFDKARAALRAAGSEEENR